MLPLLLGLGGLALGGVKSAVDKGREDRQRKLNAERTRWSPWTGFQAQNVPETDWMGNLMQGGLQGASFGQGLDNNSFMQKMMLLRSKNMGPVADGDLYGDYLGAWGGR